MLFFKYSLILLFISSNVYAGKFTSNECLKSSFKTEVKHEGKFFGLIKNNLIVSKQKCLFEISFKNILETTWKVDICREPIHIKVKSKGTESFYKRVSECTDKKSEFCSYWDELKENMQDYGLIFASGERESLATAHGQIYCTYLLLQRYLDDGVLFSMHDESKNIFEKDKGASVSTDKVQNFKEEGLVQDQQQEESSSSSQNETDDLLEAAKSSIETNKESSEQRPRF